MDLASPLIAAEAAPSPMPRIRRASRPRSEGRRALFALTLFAGVAACGGDEEVAPPVEILHAWTPIADAAPAGFCSEALAGVDAWMAGQTARPFEAPASRAGNRERYGGTAVVGSIQELLDGMSAFTYTDYISNQHHQFANLMTLVEYDAEVTPRPYLAESWELSDDGSEVTFRVRPDVYWHDGERTDAYDVAFTFERVTDAETAFPNSTFWDRYVRGAEGVEVVDSLTVRLRMEPHAGWIDPWRTVAIMPEHLLGDVAAAELGQHPYMRVCPVGNGPFVFREHRLDESWSFQANPAFPESLGGRPWLDRYVFRVIPEETTLLAELLTGGIDVFLKARPDQAARIAEDADTELVGFPFREVNFISWNHRRPPLDDARVRRALTLATDRGALVDALLEGYGRVANGTVPPFHWGYDASLEGADTFDPDAAGRLLDEAGWTDRDGDGVREGTDGTPLEITLTYNAGNLLREQIAEILQAQLAEVGVRLTPEVLEIPTLVARVLDPGLRDFDALVFGWVTEFRLDDRNLFSGQRLGQPYAFTGVSDAEIDRLLEGVAEVDDRAEATGILRSYQQRVLEVQPVTFLFFPERLNGVRTRLNGAEMDARGDLLSLREWWIDPAERR